MRRRAALCAALAFVSAAGLIASLHAQQVFRGGVEVVSLAVTVTDKEGRYIAGLDKPSFQVFEDGVLQDIVYFSREHQPIALTLLLDTSTSMEQKLPIAQQAAVGFSRQLKPSDVAAIMEFDSRENLLQDFTSDQGLLEQAIRKTAAGGSTSLYNAIYTALARLRPMRRDPQEIIRRLAVVVLSDGEDTTSVLDYDDVLAEAKRADVAVYAIGLRARHDSAAKGFREAEFVLRTLAQQTGGREFFVEDPTELPAIYRRIADELANQYSIGYMSKNSRRDGAYRRIVVRVDQPNTVTRYKQGYFAPGGSK